MGAVAVAVTVLCSLMSCGSDAPDAPPATTIAPPGTGAADTTTPPASVVSQDSPNTLGSPGSFGERNSSGG
jgi:hypothetical protein